VTTSEQGNADDTEGQSFKMKAEQGEPESEDTEGNRIKLIRTPGVDAEEASDDTEGNRIKLIRGES
jgi:hypothetical protein